VQFPGLKGKYMTGKIAALMIPVLIMLLPCSSFAADDNFGEHFSYSVLFGTIGETCVHTRENFNAPMKILTGTVIGTFPGLVKEIGDSTSKNNHFSVEQLMYDMMGSAVGSVIAYNFHNRTKVAVSRKEETLLLTFHYSY
jgi:VanZ family protein